MSTYETALALFYQDTGRLPPATSDPAKMPLTGISPANYWTFQALASSMAGEFPALLVEAEGISTGTATSLTTPVTYLNQYFPDNFSPDKKAPFAYYASGSAYLIWSAGPDGVYDIRPEYYDFASLSPKREFIARYIYDVTNGTKSSGDILRFRWLTAKDDVDADRGKGWCGTASLNEKLSRKFSWPR